jgi:CRISPR type III-B/RAMP module RAMP protein Cmr1
MNKWKDLEIAIVTPLFSSGADKKWVEIRPPSIKGELRFWFRAMMYGLLKGKWQDTKPILQKLEARIFGNTDCSSPLQIRIKTKNTIFQKPEEVCDLSKTPGVFYFGFPFYRVERGNNYILNKANLQPKSTFILSYCLNSNSSETLQIVEDVMLGSLWLMLHFGGLGARTRRAFGGLQLLLPASVNSQLNFSFPKNPTDIVSYFSTNLKSIEQLFSNFVGTEVGSIFEKSNDTPKFSSFMKWKTSFITSPRWTSWQVAMDDLGKFLRSFRNNSTNAPDLHTTTSDYKNVISKFLPTPPSNKIITQNDFWVIQSHAVTKWDLRNDAFGLPLQIRSQTRSDKASKLFKGKFNISTKIVWQEGNNQQIQDGRWHDRRSSPLFIRLLPITSKQWVAIILLLDAEFLPPGATEFLDTTGRWPYVKEVPKPSAKQIDVADLSILYDFLNSIEKQKNLSFLGSLP